MRKVIVLGALLVGSTATWSARADVPLDRVLAVRGGLFGGEPRRVPVFVDDRAEAERLGLRPITEHVAIATAPANQSSALLASLPAGRARFAPPRRPLLERATDGMRAAEARNESGLDGSGVLLGLIDTGVDVRHSAFFDADGRTRIEWLLVFGEAPRGVHAALEDEYGCTVDDACAIYSAADLDALLAQPVGRVPTDRPGHGTHVLSTMGGRDETYGGIAPGARLLVVQAASASGSLYDADILTGARFLFDRAAEMEKPLALNLSLGSGFGNHDGSSALERGLSEMLGGPGRAIVVASGNDGSLFGGFHPDYPEPFGKHVEMSVPDGSEVELPLILPGEPGAEYTGEVYVWITVGAEDDLEFEFEASGGRRAGPISRGESLGIESALLGDEDEYEIAALFGGEEAELGIDARSIVVLVSGTFEGGRTLRFFLRGSGYLSAWAEAAGEFSTAASGTGPLFPRARVGGTVAIPATASALISVGSSVNRNSWIDASGEERSVGVVPGELSSFSSAGPSALGFAKPDVVAPGEYLVAAMSASADPRDPGNVLSQFAGAGRCPDAEECFVVDDEHAISSGTSMAAPLVAGTIALLLERDPTLTQERIRGLLRGGARPDFGDLPPAWFGAGHLDVVGTLRAQERALEASGAEPSLARSKVSFANTFVPSDAALETEAMALLRDAEGEPARPLGLEELRLEVESGKGRLGASDSGAVRFFVSAAPRSGGEMLRARLWSGERLLAEGELPIGPDPYVARLGWEAGAAYCSTASVGHSRRPLALAFFPLALLALRVIRRSGRPERLPRTSLRTSEAEMLGARRNREEPVRG